MSTFSELQSKLTLAKERKTVLVHLVDYLEENFIGISSEIPPKRFVLSDDKTTVSQSAFDGVVDELLKEVAELDGMIDNILKSTLKTSKDDKN